MRSSVAKVAVPEPKPVIWIGSSWEDLKTFPDPVQKGMGYALWFAQIGSKHPNARPLRGFGGAGVVEIIDAFEGNTYRGVYTVRLAGTVYVLHCFQKKARRGIQTTLADLALIRSRLSAAEADYQARKGMG